MYICLHRIVKKTQEESGELGSLFFPGVPLGKKFVWRRLEMSGISQTVQKKFCYCCRPDNSFSLDVYGGGRGCSRLGNKVGEIGGWSQYRWLPPLKNRPRVILNKWPSTG